MSTGRALLSAGWLLAAVWTAAAQEVSVKDGTVELPGAGETATRAFGVVSNPTMYDVYLVSASTEVAGSVEMRRGDEAKALRDVTIPAYGSVAMAKDGIHMRLVDLNRPLEAGESITLSLKTDGGATLKLTAVVE